MVIRDDGHFRVIMRETPHPDGPAIWIGAEYLASDGTWQVWTDWSNGALIFVDEAALVRDTLVKWLAVTP
jgi:hypothetical protein